MTPSSQKMCPCTYLDIELTMDKIMYIHVHVGLPYFQFIHYLYKNNALERKHKNPEDLTYRMLLLNRIMQKKISKITK